MNAKQKLHSVKLTHWTALFKDQASSGLTVKTWCLEHNISIHTYNYWKHQLKMECLDSLLPSEHDIVPLANPIITSSTFELLCPNDMLRESQGLDSISISCGDVQITIGPFLFPIPCFYSVEGPPPRSKDFSGKVMAFCSSTKE